MIAGGFRTRRAHGERPARRGPDRRADVRPRVPQCPHRRRGLPSLRRRRGASRLPDRRDRRRGANRGDRSDDTPRRSTRCSLRTVTRVLGCTHHVDGSAALFRSRDPLAGDRRRGQQRRGRRSVHAPPAACPKSHADPRARTRLGSRDGWSCRRLNRRTGRGQSNRTSAGFRGRRVDSPAARTAGLPKAHRDRQDRPPRSGARAHRPRPVVRSALDRDKGTGRGEPSPGVGCCGRGRHSGRRGG